MDENTFREFERNVLDRAYLSHPIWAYNKNEILYSLFAAFDSMLLPFITLPEKSIGQLQIFKSIEEGFVQALVWYHGKYGIVKPLSSSNNGLICAAGDFLLFCAKYAVVAHFHISVDKKLCTVDVDKESRIVTFIPTSKQWDGGGGFGQGAYVETVLHKEIIQSINDESVVAELKNIPFSLLNGRVVFNDFSFLASQLLIDKATSGSRIERLYLPKNSRIHGFKLKQFEKIKAILQTWAFAARTIYLTLAHQGVAQEDCMPTQLIETSDLIKILSRYSEVDEQIVKQIVTLLSFGTIPKPDVYLQPLYVAEDMCLWSPFVLGKTKGKRNLLKLLARMPSGSDEIANLIGSREANILNDLGLFFAKRGGYSYKLNTQVSHGPDKGEVDMLIYNPKVPSEVLVVELKCILPVDDINEVCSATNEMVKAQDQIRKIWRILSSSPNNNKKKVYPFVNWGKVTSYYGLVVTPESYPSRNYVHDEVPATTIQIIKFHLKTKDLKKPSTICRAFKQKSWNENPTSEIVSYDVITIGDVIYRIPGVELSGAKS